MLANDNLPEELGEFSDGIVVLSADPEHEGEGWERPGWDPDNPWDEPNALERARHYWPIAKERVGGGYASPAPRQRRCYLLLATSTDRR